MTKLRTLGQLRHRSVANKLCDQRVMYQVFTVQLMKPDNIVGLNCRTPCVNLNLSAF